MRMKTKGFSVPDELSCITVQAVGSYARRHDKSYMVMIWSPFRQSRCVRIISDRAAVNVDRLVVVYNTADWYTAHRV